MDEDEQEHRRVRQRGGNALWRTAPRRVILDQIGVVVDRRGDGVAGRGVRCVGVARQPANHRGVTGGYGLTN